eukprot:10527139-Alexandrium_andersonii.AAC.1
MDTRQLNVLFAGCARCGPMSTLVGAPEVPIKPATLTLAQACVHVCARIRNPASFRIGCARVR